MCGAVGALADETRAQITGAGRFHARKHTNVATGLFLLPNDRYGYVTCFL